MLLLSACPSDGKDLTEADIIKITADGNSYAVVLHGMDFGVSGHFYFVGEILDALAEEGFNFKFSGSSSDIFGRMITEFGDLRPAAGEFIAFYSTVNDPNFSFLPNPLVFDGVEYFFANYGIDQMPIIDGATYLFVVEVALW
jgi:hypothetical protein